MFAGQLVVSVFSSVHTHKHTHKHTHTLSNSPWDFIKRSYRCLTVKKALFSIKKLSVVFVRIRVAAKIGLW